MTDPRQAALQVVSTVLKKGTFSDSLLEKINKKHKSRESEFIYNLVKGTIKLHYHLDYIIKNLAGEERFDSTDIKIKSLLYMAFYQMLYMDSVPDHAALNENVELAKKLFGDKVAGLVNALMRAWQRNPEITYPDDPALRIAAEHSYPPDLIKRWLKIWNRETVEYLCMHFNEPAMLHVRVNQMETTPEKLQKYFARLDVELSLSLASENMLISNDAKGLLNDVAFSEGYYSIQDTSAALVAELVDPQPNESVLDMFAAPGGKATYMAELMQNMGELIAIDKSPKKVKKLKQAAQRLKLGCIKEIAEDALNYGPRAAAFDRVLLDVPCSGWGVFARKADLRWQANQDLKSLVKIQEAALNTGSLFVKPGGVLVYSTCTMNPDENQRQIEKFLSTHPNFTLQDASKYIKAEYVSHGCLTTIPHKHNMDGAFAARLVKNIGA